VGAGDQQSPQEREKREMTFSAAMFLGTWIGPSVFGAGGGYVGEGAGTERGDKWGRRKTDGGRVAIRKRLWGTDSTGFGWRVLLSIGETIGKEQC